MNKHVAIVQHQLEQISSIAPRFENPNRAKSVTIDVFPSVMKPVSLDDISSFPKVKVLYGRRKLVGAE
jgi:hypothetical protein